MKSFVAASLDIVVKGLNTYGTLTLYELFRFVFSNGKSVMKERFIKKSLKPGVLKEFRKLVASQYVLKGLISEQMLESVYIDSQLMDSLGDDLIVAGPAQAFKSNRLGCTCLAENTLLRPQPGSEGYCVELLQTPCSSPDCPFPYLLVYSLPARDLGAQSWGQIAPILSCQAVFDAAVSVNKRSRIDANSDTTQSEINRPLASFSDISAIDMIQLKKSWTSQRNEDWLANL